MIRNFWIEGRIDGRNTTLEGGPRNREGGFDVIFTQRHQGSIIRALTVAGWERNGKLFLRVHRGDGSEVYQLETER